jgi:hypothetical protein
VLPPLLGSGCGIGGIETIDHLLEFDRVRLELLGEVYNRAHAQRRSDRRDNPIALRGLDPLGDLDFSLSCEQGDLAHFPQVDPNRIDRPTVVVDVSIRAGRALPLRLGLAGRNDGNALLSEDRPNLIDAARAEVRMSKGVLDLVDGQKSLSLTLGKKSGEQRARKLAPLVAGGGRVANARLRCRLLRGLLGTTRHLGGR